MKIGQLQNFDGVEQLIGAIDAMESNSYGSDTEGLLGQDRAHAIEYYLGKNVEPNEAGRSQVVDRSVYETIQWIKPSLARIFANGDDVVTLPPIGPDDEAAAKQESQYLNWLLLNKTNWFQTFDTAATDALLNKAGYLYCYKEDIEQTEVERYERQTEQGVKYILQDKSAQLISMKEYPDPDYVPTPQQVMTPQGPQQVIPPPQTLVDLKIRRKRPARGFCIEVLAPERVKVAKTCTTVQVKDSDYFEYWDFPTISDLRSMGYEVPDDVGSDHDTDRQEDAARDQYAEMAWLHEENPNDPAMRRVRCRWIWMRYDLNEDGISELLYVTRIGNNIFGLEEVNRIPIAVLCPDPLPHRHVGNAIADVVIDIQRIKTVILRDGLDNLRQTNNARTFLNPDKINLDDQLVSRPGGVVRGKAGKNAVYGQDYMPITVPFVFPQAMQGLEYMDQVKENRTGTSRYMTGVDQNTMNQTAMGIQQLSTMASQRVEQVARNFSNGIEVLFEILHEIVLMAGARTDVVKLNGNWIEVNPAEWRRRTDFRIAVGYAAGNRDALAAKLGNIWQMQMQSMTAGIPVVQPSNMYETLSEYTKAAGLTQPERFWSEPSQIPPRPPPQPDPTVMAQEQLRTQSAERQRAAELESKEREKRADISLGKYKADLDAKTALALEDVRAHHAAQAKHLETQLSGIGELAKAHAASQPSVDMAEQVSGMANHLTGVMAGVHQAIGHMHGLMTAQRRIRRGKDGKALGVDLLGPDGSLLASQSVERGPDGRIAGSL